MDTVALTTKDRRDMQRIETNRMQTMSVDSVAQIVGCALDCITHPAIYRGCEIQDEDALRAALLETFRLVSPCLTDKAAKSVFHLFTVLNRREIQGE